ncbi:MAG TPA: co-chaperone GroES [Deltaproteobacteria bacterium]|nr:co-chaperone GroES [Deltaproteobacteria bacterium]
MTVQPLYDRVLVKRKDPETQSRGGLFLPESAQKRSHLAEVVAIGQGRIGKDGQLVPLKVEVGMTVLLSEWGGDEVKLKGEPHLFVKEKDILAVAL